MVYPLGLEFVFKLPNFIIIIISNEKCYFGQLKGGKLCPAY